MSFEKHITKKSKPYIESLADDLRARRDKNFFWPTGTQVYTGRQGSGKTISLVKHLLDLKKRYPLALVVSNLILTQWNKVEFGTKGELGYRLSNFDVTSDYIYFSDMEQLSIALVTVNNGTKGVIYVIDEIHTYFNALDSKNIPMFIFTEISQQRKQRKLILGTSQLFLRMAKPFREQCDNLIFCKTVFGIFTVQKAYDGMTLEQDYDGSLSGDVKKTGWFFHNRKIRNSFDTFQKVVSGVEQYEATQQPIQLSVKGKGKKIKISK